MNLTRAFDIILKSQSYGVGTIRTWANGKQYQKQSNGKWVEHIASGVKQVATAKQEPKKESSYEEDYKDVTLKLGDGIDKKDAYKLMAVSGVPKGFVGVCNVKNEVTVFKVSIDNQDIYMNRYISKSKEYISNFSFSIKNKVMYNGTDIFNNQVKNASKEGYHVIETIAIRGKSVNGYYTWLRLGYKPDFHVDDILSKMANKQLGTSVSSVTELMFTQEGRDWWKVNGMSFDGAFDLSEYSYSMRTLDEYVKNKNKDK